MTILPTPLHGAAVVELKLIQDDRGFFARTFCAREFEAAGLNPVTAQCNLSFNHHVGTLRGMHFQKAPAEESKLVRCTRGSVYDAIVDMRAGSPTYLQHFGVELSESNRRALYIPGGFAHGYLTLTDGAEVAYQVGEFYTPGCEDGLRYNDPHLGIKWPIEATVLSEKDAAWPLLADRPEMLT